MYTVNSVEHVGLLRVLLLLVQLHLGLGCDRSLLEDDEVVLEHVYDVLNAEDCAQSFVLTHEAETN